MSMIRIRLEGHRDVARTIGQEAPHLLARAEKEAMDQSLQDLKQHVEADAALLGAGWLPIRVWESDFKKDPEGTAERVEETVRSRMPPPESSARRAERSPS